MKPYKLFASVISLAFAAGGLFAADLFVGTPSDDGAADSLRSLVASAANGDRILIPAGMTVVITNEIVLPYNRKLDIVGMGSPEDTTVTNTAISRIFHVTASDLIYTNSFFNLGFAGNVNTNANQASVLQADGAYLGLLFISNCVFKANSAQGSGGAILSAQTSAAWDGFKRCARVEDSVFEGNSSQQQGGAAYVRSAEFIRCVFRGNFANGIGGSYNKAGGAVSSTDGGRVFFGGCEFIDNGIGAGAQGGAIYTQAETVIEDCVFTGNSAYKGGAVFSQAWNVSSPHIRRCVFTGNTSGDVGMTVMTVGSAYTLIEDCVFENNNHPSQGWPSTLYAESNKRFIVDRGVFRGNNTRIIDSWTAGDTLEFRDSVFENNATADDSIMYVRNSPLSLENCSFVGNSARSDIVMAVNRPVSMVNCTFAENTVASRGIIANHNAANAISMTHCTVWSNSVPDAAIYATYGAGGGGESHFVMTNCVVAQNTKPDGSVADIWRGVQTIKNCVFSSPSNEFVPMANPEAVYENVIWGAAPARIKLKEPAENDIEWTFLDGSKLPTLAFDAGSILHNAGTRDIDESITTDARGKLRRDKNSFTPDIGAYELHLPLATLMWLR